MMPHDQWKLYAKADGLFAIDGAGTVTGPFRAAEGPTTVDTQRFRPDRLPDPWGERAGLEVYRDERMRATIMRASGYLPDGAQWGSEVSVDDRDLAQARDPGGAYYDAVMRLVGSIEAYAVREPRVMFSTRESPHDRVYYRTHDLHARVDGVFGSAVEPGIAVGGEGAVVSTGTTSAGFGIALEVAGPGEQAVSLSVEDVDGNHVGALVEPSALDDLRERLDAFAEDVAEFAASGDQETAPSWVGDDWGRWHTVAFAVLTVATLATAASAFAWWLL